MFTRRRSLDRRRRYTREFFQSLVGRLRDAGFDEITVVLPHNYPSVDPRQPEELVEAFLARERNFAAVILKARATERKEAFKILFINSNARAIFADDTFPLAESEPSGMYFESPDPGRAYSVFEYFFEYLSEPLISRFIALSYGGLLATVFLVAEAFALIGKKAGLLQFKAGISAWWDAAAAVIAAYTVFRFSAAPTGLWIKPRRELKVTYLLNMAMKGEFRDNPLVQLAITIIAGLIVAGLAKLLGWI